MARTLDKLTCWLPEEWNPDSPPFVLSAEHRGDMYHIRAAMSAMKQTDPSKHRALILYACSEKNTDLQDYLLETSNLCLQTSLSFYDRCNGKPKPGDLAYKVQGVQKTVVDLKQDEFERRSESDATYLIVQSVKAVANDQQKTENLLQAIRTGMVTFDDDSRKEIQALQSTSKAVSTKLFSKLKPDNSPAVIVMHRDSGSTGGAYPELDTGYALQQMLEVIASVPGSASGSLCTLVICGLEAGKCNGNPTIGEYWGLLKDPDRDKRISKRAVEAGFLQYLYNQNFYKLAVGFRSGALDLYTFLGIPTVSVGLNWMVGEARHLSLATETFKRMNVQYALPRHPATAWIADKNNLDKDEDRLNSPGTKTPKAGESQGAAAAGKAEMIQGPGPFSAFDKSVFEVAIRLSVPRYIRDSPQTLYSQRESDFDINVVAAEHARKFPPNTMPKGQGGLEAYRDTLMKMEQADLVTRRSRQNSLQERPEYTVELVEFSKSDWEKTRNLWKEAAQKAADKAEEDETGFKTVRKGRK